MAAAGLWMALAGAAPGWGQTLNLTLTGYTGATARIGVVVDGGALTQPRKVQVIPAPGSNTTTTSIALPAGGPYRIRAVDGISTLGATFFAVTRAGRTVVDFLNSGQVLSATVTLGALSAQPDPASPTTAITNSTVTLAVNAQDPAAALDLEAATIRYGTNASNLNQTAQGSAARPTAQTWRVAGTVSTPATPGTLYYQVQKSLADFNTTGLEFVYVWPAQGPQAITVIDGSSAPIPVSPTSLSFTFAQGSEPPAPKNLSLSGGIAAISFTVSVNASGGNWLSASPLTGRTPATVVVSVNPAGLAPGVYLGTVDITAAGPAASTRSVQVTFTVTGPSGGGPVLVVAPATVSFTASPTSPPPPAQEVNVTSTGAPISFSVTASSNPAWLIATPILSSTPAKLSLSVTSGGLAPGTYNGSVTVSPQGGGNAVVIGVTLTVGAAQPSFTAEPASLQFQTATTASQTLMLRSTGTALSFQASAVSPGNWLTVAPVLGTTPAQLTVTVNPQNLQPGTYQGTIEVTSSAAANSPFRIGVVLTLAGTPGGPLLSAVVSAASYEGLSVAPGEIVTIFGTDMGPANLVPLRVEGARVATELAGTRVLVNGEPAPLIYTSATQIGAVVPYGVAGTSGAFFRVEYQGRASQTSVLLVAASKPGLFTLDSTGLGQGAVLNQDNSVNGPGNPAARGTILQIFATGEGQTVPAGVDGSISTAPLPRPVLPVRVFLEGREAEVLYAGAAPGNVAGVLQVNVRIPEAVVPSSAVGLVLEVGGRRSQAGVTVAVR